MQVEASSPVTSSIHSSGGLIAICRLEAMLNDEVKDIVNVDLDIPFWRTKFLVQKPLMPGEEHLENIRECSICSEMLRIGLGVHPCSKRLPLLGGFSEQPPRLASLGQMKSSRKTA